MPCRGPLSALGGWGLLAGKSEPGEPITETRCASCEKDRPDREGGVPEGRHIIYGAWESKHPTASLPSPSPPMNGPANPKTTNPASTLRSRWARQMPFARSSWTPPPGPLRACLANLGGQPSTEITYASQAPFGTMLRTGGFRLAWDELQHTHRTGLEKSCHMPLRGAHRRTDRTGLTGYGA